MTSRIKHLQHAKLYPSICVASTKSVTPNQLRLRASDCVRVSRQSVRTFIFLFLLFLFLLAFYFLFYLDHYIGLHTWVTQPYYGSSTGLRPALQGGKRYIAS